MNKISLKPIMAFPLSWSLYWFGDKVSPMLEWDIRSEFWGGVVYRLYNIPMVWSVKLQDWAGGEGPKWPWQPVVEGDN
jgi:hypothetical protein